MGMMQCMMDMTENMNGTMLVLMGLCIGLGIAFGLSMLAGTFYFIWRFIRALEKRS